MSSTAPAQSSPIAELPRKYVPSEHEPVVRDRWDRSGAFHADPRAVLAGEGKPYCVLIPPPNVTARLHLGHALNNSLQDILVRAHRMKGYQTLWMPGTDHAGIATQTVVDKRLQAEGEPALKDYKLREAKGESGREEFVAKVQEWKDEFEGIITGQLKMLGCSCDWDRQRFTMDDVCARAVREAFFQLFKDGLIYRGKRLVNWDPVTQTALADDEVEMTEVDGNFYYLHYPLVDDSGAYITVDALRDRGYPPAHLPEPVTLDGTDNVACITVATTRPETYFGDTGVAINPADPRAESLRGLKVKLPIVGRVIPIVEDDYVVMPDFITGEDSGETKAQMATGFLKVTPAHDPNDWEIGQRHGLEVINVMAPDASISATHGWDDLGDAQDFIGMPREDARIEVKKRFKQLGLLGEVKPYRHSVGHSYRSHAAIEPYLSDQWYCKVTDKKLRGWANDALVPEQRTSGTTPASGTGILPVSTSSPSSSSPKTIQQEDGLTIHKRHLPHWQLAGSTYFITFRTAGDDLTPEERSLALDACFHFHNDRCITRLATVMPDHVHLLITPHKAEDGGWHRIQDLLHSIKSFSAKQINTLRGDSGPIWQDEYFDRIVRDDEEFREKWNYMAYNPVKAGLASRPGEYPFTRVGEMEEREEGEDGQDARPTERDTRGSGSGSLRFYPDRYAKTYEGWHDNLRDWCISRQLWWGHRIPVWTRQTSSGDPSDTTAVARFKQEPFWRDKVAVQRDGANEYVCVDACSEADEVIQELERDGYAQDPDVLDTWFSSALWPLSTLGWPDPEQSDDTRDLLDAFNPTSVLSTGRDIITLWVSRMVMFNRYFLSPDGGRTPGQLPFSDVFIHAMIQDGEGRKMSKSLGNGVDPLDIINSHGADAMRFTLAHMATNTQDVRLPVELDESTGKNTSPKFDLGRNFVTKLFNATKFALMNIDEATTTSTDPVKADAMSATDKWMLSRLRTTVDRCEAALANYTFSDYASALYDVLWRDYCDWYLEAVKPTVKTNPTQQAILVTALDAIVRLLHPVCPFVTETLHPHIQRASAKVGEVPGIELGEAEVLLCTTPWPDIAPDLRDDDAEASFEFLRGLTESVRQVRAQNKIGFKTPVTLHVPGDVLDRIKAGSGLVETLSNSTTTTDDPGAGAVPFTYEAQEYFVSGFADGSGVDAESARAQLEESKAKLAKDISALEGRLANKGYTDKAPAHLVEETRNQLEQKKTELASVTKRLDELG